MHTLLRAANGWEDFDAIGWDGTFFENLYANGSENPTAYNYGYQVGFWGTTIAGGLAILRCVPALVRSRGAATATSPAANVGTKSIDDVLRPGGVAVGKAGTDDTIREITGGLPEARAMFQQLSQGGSVVAQTPKLTRVELPNGGSFVQLRTLMSRSPNTAATIDVNIPGLNIRKLKYNP